MNAKAVMALRPRSDVVVVVGELELLGFGQLLLEFRPECRVHVYLRRKESGRGDEREVRVADELAREVKEGLLEVVVGLGRDVIVLKGGVQHPYRDALLDFGTPSPTVPYTVP